MFESKQRFIPHPGEARIFWWSLYIFTAIWILLAFVALLKLNFFYLVRALVGDAVTPVVGGLALTLFPVSAHGRRGPGTQPVQRGGLHQV